MTRPGVRLAAPVVATLAAAWLLLAAVAAAAQTTSPSRSARDDDLPTYLPLPVAKLQAMDKVTARVWPLTVPVGETVRFGTLDIQVQNCVTRPPEEPPENAVFLSITDQLRSGEEVELFRGWMFASSPALSALEHGVYDVWLVDCVDRP